MIVIAMARWLTVSYALTCILKLDASSNEGSDFCEDMDEWY